MEGTVLLDHGEGGAATARLVREMFLVHFGGPSVLEDAAELEEMTSIRRSVLDHLPREGPSGPIGALELLVEPHIQMDFEQGREAEFRLADESRRDHRVEQVSNLQLVVTAKEP